MIEKYGQNEFFIADFLFSDKLLGHLTYTVSNIDSSSFQQGIYMSNTIPVGKKIMFAGVSAVIGYVLIVGFSSSGAAGMALGLFLGVFFSQKILALSLLTNNIGKKISKKEMPVMPINDSDIVSIFVGNLAFKVRGRQLAELFEPYGAIESIRIVKDRNTGRGKGFGFVDMKGVGAKKAIAELNDSEFFGRTLKVSQANAQNNA